MKLCEVANLPKMTPEQNEFIEAIMEMHNEPKVEIQDDGTVNVTGKMFFDSPYFMRFKKFPVKFGTVYGSVKMDLANITSLKELPRRVTGMCTYDHVENVSDIKDITPRVDGLLSIRKSGSVKSLHDLPRGITKLELYECPYVTSLDGLPENLKFLSVSYCKKLKSYKGIKPNVSLSFFHNTGIESLEGLPEKVSELEIVSNEKLTTLKGCPRIVNGDFKLLSATNLRSLEGGPEIVIGDMKIDFLCKKLENLDHLPHEIRGNLVIDCLPKSKDYLKIFDIHGVNIISMPNILVADILNRWYPTKNITKAQQELEKAGLGEYAEY